MTIQIHPRQNDTRVRYIKIFKTKKELVTEWIFYFFDLNAKAKISKLTIPNPPTSQPLPLEPGVLLSASVAMIGL